MGPAFVRPGSLIDRRPALRVGEAECIDRITADDLRAFAREAGYAPRFTLERVGKIANALLEHLQAVGDALATRGVDENRLRRATDAIAHNATRLLGEISCTPYPRHQVDVPALGRAGTQIGRESC